MLAQKPLPKYTLPLSILVGILVLIACLTALIWDGLYADEATSGTAQALGQDWVTTVWVIPLYAVVLYYLQRGSLRARLAWIGLLVYFLYTYLAYAVLMVYNEMFLVYVAAYSLSLVLLITGISSLNLEALPEQFSDKTPRRGVGIFGLVAAAFLAFLWLGDIIPSLISGQPPARINDTVTDSLVIQAMDLGLIVPIAVIGGIALLRGKPLGYLLSGIILMKVVSLGTALIAMVIFMYAAGTPPQSVIEAAFPFVLIVPGVYFAVRYFGSIKPTGEPKAALVHAAG